MALAPITIVGAGQIGSLVALNLVRNGHRVRIFDSGTKAHCPNAQVPWGWFRKVSLQPKAKVHRSPATKLEFPDADINATYGPMLITTRDNGTVAQWKAWCEDNPTSDARILTPSEGCKEFDLQLPFFGQNRGGVFVCDSRDHLMDFRAFNRCVWNVLQDSPNCEFHEGCEVLGFNARRGVATSLNIRDSKGVSSTVDVGAVLLAVGNRTRDLLPAFKRPPFVRVRLPYSVLSNNELGVEAADALQLTTFVALWSDQSSLSLFADGSAKLSCGLQSVMSFKEATYQCGNLINSLPFLRVLLNGVDNLIIGVDYRIEVAMGRALTEATAVTGIPLPQKFQNTGVQWCDVDLTPNLCPVVDRCSTAKNVLYAAGLSGSSAVALDEWFSASIARELVSPESCSHPDDLVLASFRRVKGLKNHWYPDPAKVSPIGAMGSQVRK